MASISPPYSARTAPMIARATRSDHTCDAQFFLGYHVGNAAAQRALIPMARQYYSLSFCEGNSRK